MSDEVIDVAKNGQPVTQSMINARCEAYDKGEFPEEEYSTGHIWYGIPKNSNLIQTISFKVTESFEKDVKEAAQKHAISISEFCRQAILEELIFKPLYKIDLWHTEQAMTLSPVGFYAKTKRPAGNPTGLIINKWLPGQDSNLRHAD